MKSFPRIRLEPLGIEALDMRPAQDDIRAKYGPLYHVNDACLREVAALWGIEPQHECINDVGVFIPYVDIAHRAGRCRAEIHYARSPTGLYAMDTSYMTAIRGGGASPSVWNRVAFLSEADARAAGLHALIERFRRIADEGGPDSADIRRMVDLLLAERTPQLSLL